ncbi:hypothetical protein MiAbW_02276 [Microcystis aeruginosa NIES-4325]|uniref:Uncharacterized protein n=1 Tax=Microcystis aeruginosa NIES-4325 TaxID=2569534 RepID=A0A5J4F9S5_MICAE|nr:hypothetical protein MiAbW_02276 [Microcystis aeruginosa NIES-4325]
MCLLSKKSGLKPRVLMRKFFGAGHKSPLQKRPPFGGSAELTVEACPLPPLFSARLASKQERKNYKSGV